MICALAMLAPCAPAAAQDALAPQTVEHISRLLEGSGYNYTKRADRTWRLTLPGTSRNDLYVYVSATNEELLIIAVVAYSHEVAATGEAAMRLLQFNYDSGLPVSVDADDDFVVTNYYDLKRLDAAAFKKELEAVAGVADRAHATIAALSTAGSARSAATSSGSKTTGEARDVELLGGRASISVDPAVWREQPTEEPGRLELVHHKGDGYAVIISERLQFDLSALRNLALANARKFSADMTITAEEPRRVGGTEVLMLQISGTVNGARIIYLGYFWSGAAGTVQLITYTGDNLLAEYRPDFEALLNTFRVEP